MQFRLESGKLLPADVEARAYIGKVPEGSCIELHVFKEQRTPSQQSAIEVYCRLLAEALNDGGIDQRAFFNSVREGVEIQNTQASIKGAFREFGRILLGKKSTAKWDTTEVSRVYDAFNDWTGRKFGVSIDFPHKEDE